MCKFNVSIRAYYDPSSHEREAYSQHYRQLTLSEVGEWLYCYFYTHPGVKTFTVKVWMEEQGGDSVGQETSPCDPGK